MKFGRPTVRIVGRKEARYGRYMRPKSTPGKNLNLTGRTPPEHDDPPFDSAKLATWLCVALYCLVIDAGISGLCWAWSDKNALVGLLSVAAIIVGGNLISQALKGPK
jgi:hypothetical protein